MSTERELVEKFKEAIGSKNIKTIYPYLAEGMTYEVLPSTFVTNFAGASSRILSVLMQDLREENEQG